ncbi:unnamed protein product, partial [Pelagomonas calceolata]
RSRVLIRTRIIYSYRPRRPRAHCAQDDTAEVALTEAQEDALRKVFNRVDISGDGHISVIEAIKALRGARSSTGIEADFARLLGLDDMTRIHQEDGTRDKLMLAFGALDADGDKKLSYEEFRRRGAWWRARRRRGTPCWRSIRSPPPPPPSYPNAHKNCLALKQNRRLASPRNPPRML